MRRLLVLCVLAGCKPHAVPRREVAPPGQARGAFDLTYYWMSTPSPGHADTVLYAKDCHALATVSAAYARELTETGNGRLPDGRTLVVAGDCACARAPCFRDETQNPWGTGAGDRPLIPFRSIAVDRSVIPIGTRLYIEELDRAARHRARAARWLRHRRRHRRQDHRHEARLLRRRGGCLSHPRSRAARRARHRA